MTSWFIFFKILQSGCWKWKLQYAPRQYSVSTGWNNSSHFSTCDGDFRRRCCSVIWSDRVVLSVGLPRLPDLNPCDFFSGDTSIRSLYVTRPQSIEHLNEAIRQEIPAMPQYMARRVTDDFRDRFWQLVDDNGSRLTDLIFKTQLSRMTLYILFNTKNTLFCFWILLNLLMCQNYFAGVYFLVETRSWKMILPKQYPCAFSTGREISKSELFRNA